MKSGRAVLLFILLGIFLVRRVLKLFADAADAKVKAERARRGQVEGAAPAAPAPAMPLLARRMSAWVPPDLDRERVARATRLEARKAAYEQAARAAARREEKERAADIAGLTGAAMEVPEPPAEEETTPVASTATPPSVTSFPVASTRAPVLQQAAPEISPWLAALRDPESARKAILLKEILGPPVGLR